MRPRSQLLVLGLLVLIWGTTWAAIRVGLSGIPPFTGVAIRFGIAGLALLVVARLRGVRLGATAGERWLWLSNGLLNFALPYGLVYWSEQYLPSGIASVLFATFPLFVALLSHFFLPGERLTRRAGLGVLVGFAGVYVLSSADLAPVTTPQAAWAAWLMLLSPLSSAAGQVIVKKSGGAHHPFSLTSVPMLLTAVLAGSLALAVEGGRPVHWSPAAVGSVLYLSLAGSALTFTLYFDLLSTMRATDLSLIAYLIPVVAVVIGIAAFDEPFTLRIALGCLAILAGVALAMSPRARAS